MRSNILSLHQALDVESMQIVMNSLLTVIQSSNNAKNITSITIQLNELANQLKK